MMLVLFTLLFTFSAADDFVNRTELSLLTFDNLCQDFSWVKTNESLGFQSRFAEFDGIGLEEVAEFTLRRTLGDDLEVPDDPKENVDCFGLGTTLSKMFRWIFQPQKKEIVNTQFYLSTRAHPDKLLLPNNGSLLQVIRKVYHPSRTTVFIVHGFMSNSDMFWVKDMTRALLERENMNVVVVDWGGGSMSWKYWRAVGNTRVVGQELSKLLKHLIRLGTPRSKLHLIGHSLGAHICGFAAKSVGNVGRITGLDPAQPCFKSGNQTIGLNLTDAMFVDVVHTNGKLFSNLGFGLPQPLGLVDFYPNGGQLQPGCTIKSNSIWDKLPISKTKLQNAICSHGRSYQFYIDALRAKDCRFWGRRWNLTLNSALTMTKETCAMETCAPMGLEAQSFPAIGSFFVSTRDRTPYCIHDPVTEKRMSLLAKIKKLFKSGFGSSERLASAKIGSEKTASIANSWRHHNSTN